MSDTSKAAIFSGSRLFSVSRDNYYGIWWKWNEGQQKPHKQESDKNYFHLLTERLNEFTWINKFIYHVYGLHDVYRM